MIFYYWYGHHLVGRIVVDRLLLQERYKCQISFALSDLFGVSDMLPTSSK